MFQLFHFISCVAEHPDDPILACQVTCSEDKERGHFLDGFDDGGQPLLVALDIDSRTCLVFGLYEMFKANKRYECKRKCSDTTPNYLTDRGIMA